MHNLTFFIYYHPEFSVAEMEAVSNVFEAHGFTSVEFGGTIETPEECLNKARKQFNADCLLGFFKKSVEESDRGYFIWIVNEDIYTQGTNFIFGQAELGGRFSVVSTARLKTGESSLSEIYLKRLRTEVIHEACHLLGLKHCPNPYCSLYFSNTLSDTDRKGDELCIVCREKLRLIREKMR